MKSFDQLKSRLINDVLSGKDSYYVDEQLKSTMFTEAEKYQIIKDLQPYQLQSPDCISQ